MERLEIGQLKKRLSGMTVIADFKVHALYGSCLPEGSLVITPDENLKTLSTVQLLCEKMLEKGLGRNDCLVAVGGGIVGDITGFAASVYMRGIDWVFVPTTLLALVDSSVGGKTGVNLSSRKNIIGSFHKPKQVIFCPEFLSSLPQSQLLSARAEIIKTAALDQKTFDLINANAPLDSLIESCRAYKTQITEDDISDKDCRRYLNFGHTVGHALELKYSLTHGQAVALGMRIEVFMASDTEQYLTDFIHSQTKALIKPIKISASDVAGITKTALNDKKGENNKIVLCVPVNHKEVKIVRLTEDEFFLKLTQYFFQNNRKPAKAP